MSEYHIQYLQHRYRENDDSFCSRRHEGFCEIIFLQHGMGFYPEKLKGERKAAAPFFI